MMMMRWPLRMVLQAGIAGSLATARGCLVRCLLIAPGWACSRWRARRCHASPRRQFANELVRKFDERERALCV
eukprot:1763-Chlamydomonas_euryale.AAC.1